MKRVLLAGGTGFIGRHLTDSFLRAGYEVVILSRSARGCSTKAGVRSVVWDGKSVGEWAKELEGATAIVNLCGASVSKKWTEPYKQLLLSSRIEPTTAIAHALETVSDPKPVWVNASAVGFYGNSGDRAVSSSSPAGSGFLAQLCVAWENACLGANLPGVQRVVPRLGVVLARDGGALPMLLKLTLLGLGGAVGSGLQFLSWIHIDDLCRMILWAIDGEVYGVINACTPHPVTNSEFMSTLRTSVVRPPIPNVPAGLFTFFAGLAGMESEVVLGGQRVYPVVVQSRKFEFEFDILPDAIEDLVRKG